MEEYITVQSAAGNFATASFSFSIGRIIPFSVDLAESDPLIRETFKVPDIVPEL